MAMAGRPRSRMAREETLLDVKDGGLKTMHSNKRWTLEALNILMLSGGCIAGTQSFVKLQDD